MRSFGTFARFGCVRLSDVELPSWPACCCLRSYRTLQMLPSEPQNAPPTLPDAAASCLRLYSSNALRRCNCCFPGVAAAASWNL